MDTSRCLLQYHGHTGSVNSIRFHPLKDLVLTASGDCSAHIWQAVVNWDVPVSFSRVCNVCVSQINVRYRKDTRQRKN